MKNWLISVLGILLYVNTAIAKINFNLEDNGHLLATDGASTLLIFQPHSKDVPIIGYFNPVDGGEFRLQKNEDYSILIDVDKTGVCYIVWENLFDKRTTAHKFQRTSTVGINLPIISYSPFNKTPSFEDTVLFGNRGNLYVTSYDNDGSLRYLPDVVTENPNLPLFREIASPSSDEFFVVSDISVDTNFPKNVIFENVSESDVLSFLSFCHCNSFISANYFHLLQERTKRFFQRYKKSSYRPDLCVILVDSLRADHLGCYGYERDTSPAVDAFAAGAVRFDQAIASGSWTQPSIMSIMTSVPADVHQRVHWGRPHSTNVVTLAETLRAAGYQTVGLVANPMTNRKYGFTRGFDFYDDWSLTGAPDATTGDIARQTAQGAKLTRLARDWVEKRRDPEKPLFLFVLYIDVHWDYLPPPPFNRMFAPDPVPPPRDIWNLGRASVPEAARRRSVAAYDGEIRYTDGCISNLLAAIDASPRGKDTVVVFCSDHGESFWERGVASHGNALFDEELRVPLVIRPARGDGDPAPPRVVSEQVGLIDLAPTLADLAGVPAPTNWVGRSLASALRGETLPEIPIVLDNRIGDDGAILRGVRTSRWKVLAGPPHDRPTELYDLRADPAETNNLLRAGGFALPPEVEALVPLLKPVR